MSKVDKIKDTIGWLKETTDDIMEHEDEIEELQELVENTIAELEDDLERIKRHGIYDIDNFKRELELRGLMTSDLKDFIGNYLRFSNERSE